MKSIDVLNACLAEVDEYQDAHRKLFIIVTEQSVAHLGDLKATCQTRIGTLWERHVLAAAEHAFPEEALEIWKRIVLPEIQRLANALPNEVDLIALGM